MRGGGQQRRNHVPHVGKVAPLASIAEDDDRLSLGDGIDESVERHVRSLARTIDAEKAEWHHRQSERLPVNEPQQLCRELRHAVR